MIAGGPRSSTGGKGFFIAKQVGGFPSDTVADYSRTLKLFAERWGSRGEPTATELEEFFGWLRAHPSSSNPTKKLADKMIGNSWIALVGGVARRGLWRYLGQRQTRPGDPLFVTTEGCPLHRGSLRHMLVRLGQRAGVANLHPQRPRHTFATELPRNGGNLLSLQRIL